MVKNLILMLLCIVAFSYGVENYSGFDQQSNITDTLGAGDVAYSSVYNLSKWEDIRLVVKCDDTTSAGFASDSVAVFYGYQTATVVLNSSGGRDTLYDDRIVLDTMLSSEFGTVADGSVAASGALTRTWGGADTLSVSGYACQSRWFVPEWDYLIRFFVQGLAGNKAGAALELSVEPKRRVFIPTR